MFGTEPFFVRAQNSLRGGLSWLRYVALNHVVAGSIPVRPRYFGTIGFQPVTSPVPFQSHSSPVSTTRIEG